MGNNRRLALVGITLAVLVASAPLAAAIGYGVGSTGLREVRGAGVTPEYGQIWVGTWMKTSGWVGYENSLAYMRDRGITPVILWYYWADRISPDVVQNGGYGRTRAEWDAMAKELAERATKVMGSKSFIVVLEPEFNKGGIQKWETFDGYLARQADIVKAAAPKAKIAIGFGHWGGWDIFDRAMAKADYAGTQYMRASTRDSASSAEGAADRVLQITKDLRRMFGKPVILYDLAISSYGGWEGVQMRSIQRFEALRHDLSAAGLRMVVWRTVVDDTASKGYFGAAESYWGVKYSDGKKKRAWDPLISLMNSKTTTSTSTSGSSGSSGSSGGVLSGVKGNEWWIEAKVAGSPSRVEARVDGGSWVKLDLRSWGAYAVSTRAPDKSTVDLRATYSDGRMEWAAYRWTAVTLISTWSTTSSSSGSGSSSSSPGSSSACPQTFSGVEGNSWWIQANVCGNPKRVEAKVGSGSWQPMKLASWGGWTLSTHAPKGSTVHIRATFADGYDRAAYGWTDADFLWFESSRTASPSSSTGSTTKKPCSPTFTNVQGNSWWIQASVCGKPARVEAKVNDGSWQRMSLASWGDWTHSMRVPPGSTVGMKVTYADGHVEQGAWRWTDAKRLW